MAATSNPAKRGRQNLPCARCGQRHQRCVPIRSIEAAGLAWRAEETNIETTGLTQKQAALRKRCQRGRGIGGKRQRPSERNGWCRPKSWNRHSPGNRPRIKQHKNLSRRAERNCRRCEQVRSPLVRWSISPKSANMGWVRKLASARTADSLVGSDNFANAWQGVTGVALRTHSALEETGVLFTRLVQAGKDAGMSTAAATEQSLALTETINQAIQLSDASAGASSAAITTACARPSRAACCAATNSIQIAGAEPAPRACAGRWPGCDNRRVAQDGRGWRTHQRNSHRGAQGAK